MNPNDNLRLVQVRVEDLLNRFQSKADLHRYMVEHRKLPIVTCYSWIFPAFPEKHKDGFPESYLVREEESSQMRRGADNTSSPVQGASNEAADQSCHATGGCEGLSPWTKHVREQEDAWEGLLLRCHVHNSAWGSAQADFGIIAEALFRNLEFQTKERNLGDWSLVGIAAVTSFLLSYTFLILTLL